MDRKGKECMDRKGKVCMDRKGKECMDKTSCSLAQPLFAGGLMALQSPTNAVK